MQGKWTTSSFKPKFNKVILLGSGGLSIGQAGEFDYSGTQALRTLTSHGIHVVLINPNIATVQTNPRPDVTVYLYPVTAAWVEKVIAQEQPDAIIGGFGGQTALNCLLELDKQGVLRQYGVQNLGTCIETLQLTEDRDLFREKMLALNIPVPQSFACTTMTEVRHAAQAIGYPIILRAAYALGGLGSGFAATDAELEALASTALANSPQVLIEKSFKGWKELEYEIMRDTQGNCITICNMENMDPLGIHTGDSIVVAPSQSLNDAEFQRLRDLSIRMACEMNIVGECNAQFALCPETSKVFVIEVNARLSRSSALASKASGYPIAAIAANVVLGASLTELVNPVTGMTSAFYEPAFDYITLKIPRWDLKKFSGVSTLLGSTMKSVGEIMSIGRNFLEALQKAVRMNAEEGLGLMRPVFQQDSDANITTALQDPTDLRLYAIAESLRRGVCLEEVHHLTQMDMWFLFHIKQIIDLEGQIRTQLHSTELSNIPASTWLTWKKAGFSDLQLAALAQDRYHEDASMRELALTIRQHRQQQGVRPWVKKIDTTAGEFPSSTNYLYLSYDGMEHDPIARPSAPSVIILGGGSYRIGASVEFDWCAVGASAQLQHNGKEAVIINCNPETVSTDYNSCNRLYFEELSVERVLDIAEFEQTRETIVSVGGQLPNRLAGPLEQAGLQLLGHNSTIIDTCEDRRKFSQLLDQLGIDQPKWEAATSVEQLTQFVQDVGFPLLVRPSYVLSGAAMRVVYDHDSLKQCLANAAAISVEHPVVISSFILGAREIELDGVAHQGEIIVSVVSEHVENAGIHSGDATTVVPAQRLYVETVRQIKSTAKAIATALSLHGPFNIQFMAKNNAIKVIECNARSARSFPFISKVMGFNLAKIATDVFCGQRPSLPPHKEDELKWVGVKAAMFSFSRLAGSDPVVGVEMQSTGEVGCIGRNFHEALLLALEAAHIRPPQKGVLISTGIYFEKVKFLEAVPALMALGVTIYATVGSHQFLAEHGIQTTHAPWPEEGGESATWLLEQQKVDLVINCPKDHSHKELTRGAAIRQTSSRLGIPLLTNMEKAMAFLFALEHHKQQPSGPLLHLS
ncbi:MAG: carbamoyl-phosphate synthase (glutamine-hydrolyzing) large subunit [Zetaproteobacteria bacterium]|nr:carbamoyl-phosphate synthase (glutamine-hydrolyzing) large subunit [Zetaproteobacteria bacterium]